MPRTAKRHSKLWTVLHLSLRRDFLKIMGAAALPVAQRAYGQQAPLTKTRVTGNFFVVSGAGNNVLVFNSPDGVLMVDGGSPEHSAELLKFVAAETGGKQVRVLFNTHWHHESTGSNEALGAAGAKIVAHVNTKLWLGAEIDVQWQKRVYPPLLKSARPNETFYTTGKTTFGGEPIEYGYMLQAHTDTDIYVFFPGPNVLMVGDVVASNTYPVLDWSTGGWITGMVEGQKTLLTVANAETRIIPGTGGAITRADLEAQLAKLNTIRDNLIKSFRQGKSPKEMQAEGLTKDFDAQWGNPEQFLSNAYRGLWGHVREVGGIV